MECEVGGWSLFWAFFGIPFSLLGGQKVAYILRGNGRGKNPYFSVKPLALFEEAPTRLEFLKHDLDIERRALVLGYLLSNRMFY